MPCPAQTHGVRPYTHAFKFFLLALLFTLPLVALCAPYNQANDAFVLRLDSAGALPAATPTPGPPTVAITSPADGATLYEPALVNVEAVAAATAGASVTQVDFYVNGNFVGYDTASPYHLSFGPSTATRTFVLTAVATDTRGAKTTSSPVTVNIIPPPNAQLWSQPTNYYTSIGPSAKSQTGQPSNREVADDFDVDGTIERVLVDGESSINGAAVYGVNVRFYAWQGGAPGQLQDEQFVPAGGFIADSSSPAWLDITLPTPFRATGKHFVSVQLVTDATFGWYWKSSDSGAGKRLSAVYVRDNLAGGAWAHTDYDGDGAFTLYGTPAGPPSISALSATTLPRAGRLVITGANFGSPQGAGRVLVGGVAAPVSTWTTNSITAYVPEGAAVGSDPVQVTTDLGASNTLSLQVADRPPQDGRVRWRFQAEGLYIQGRPAVGPDGTVYAVDIGAHLYALTPAGGLKWVFNAGPRVAYESVSVGADGTVYFAAGNTVYAINPDGTKRWEVSDPSGSDVAFGPGVGPDGNVYAQTDGTGDAGGLGLFSVTPAGQIRWNRPNFTHGKGEQLLTRDIVFGPPGQLYFTANNLDGTSGLYGYTLSGERRFVVPGSGQPAVAPNGNIYTVTGNMPNTQAEAAIYDPAGNLIRALFETGTKNLSWPDIGPDNTAYFGQNLQSVVALNPDGSIRWTYTDELFLEYPIASPANNSVVVDGSLMTEQGVRGFVEAIGTDGQRQWRVALPVENGTGITPDSRARFNADGSSVYVGMSTVNGNNGTQPYTYLYAFDSTAPSATPTPTPTPTAAPVNIYGRVTQAGSGLPLAGATVTLSGDASGTRQTDASGGYSFAGLAAGGAYTVTVSAPGWLFTPPSRTFLDCRLDRSAFFEASPDGDDINPPGPPPTYIDIGNPPCPECDPSTPPGAGSYQVEDTYFVASHYLDFLGRGPDTAGLKFWMSEIESCGLDAQCREVKRINVSAAFFLSIEFQQTGYLSYRARKAAFGDLAGRQVPVTFDEMLEDVKVIGDSVVVNQPGWERKLEQNKQAYFDRLAASPRFTARFPQALAPEQFIDALNANAGGALSQAERVALVADLKSNAKTRAQALRAVAEDADLTKAEFNRAFVLMQYFGYLRRNPDAPPDRDFAGYNFWLGKLNQFGGDYIRAEMVKAFISSDEYRKRFGR